MLFFKPAFTKAWTSPLSSLATNRRLAPSINSGFIARARLVYSVVHFSDKPTQSASPLAPLGVAAAVQAHKEHDARPRPKIFDEFSLTQRVAVVSGGNGSLGLEMALALCEAGARAVYCLDLPARPSHEWECTREYVKRMGTGGRLEYISADVRDQKGMWEAVEEIGDKEGRMDVCVAAAGILKPATGCLEYPAAQLKEVLDVNTNGVLFTAQAAGRQMTRFSLPGSIILVASVCGDMATKGYNTLSYNSSKAAVIQMARSMACELGPHGIRVNSLSPGLIHTKMTAAHLETDSQLLAEWNGAPLGRIGRPDELRGVITWLASDASSFCTGSNILVTGGYHAW